ncbi:beta strand repeat-containing protein [Chitinophaga eiseniae]|uniref:beta strand repeat-containing protein n=1 Tax=Chitinophaga eiseniae TaxID=634771 RepID=UPI001FFD482C|nr:hypothetical protein [Chitinophaga eiseniae]
MRSFFSIIFLLFIGTFCYAQHVYQIKADSVRIYNTCDTAELILENRTQKVPGFLFNKGNGRTEFQQLKFTSPGLGLLGIQGQDTVNLPNVLSPWSDGRYDLLSTNFVTIPSGDSMLWSQWYANKAIGYFAYASPDMPALSAQAFYGVGGKSYYNGLVVKTATTGFDFAVNWNGELAGPNGAFIRIKDDTKTAWSPWRELLFKDYADKSYIVNQKLVAQAASLWINGSAKIGDSVVLSGYSNNITEDSVLTTDINGKLKLVAGKWLPIGTTTSGMPEGSNLYWTTARGDARYPLLTGSYVDPTWLSILSWAKIRGTPSTLAGYGIGDAAPASGSMFYIQNQQTVAQTGANFWIAGGAVAGAFSSTAPTNVVADLMLYNGGLSAGNRRWSIYKSITETGTGNVGSNFNIARYSDAGGQIDVPLSINRSTGEVTLGTVNNEATDVDKFLVSNGGVLRYRTGAQTLADIGAAPSSGAGNYIQNGTTAQTANFNITGNGTFGSMASFAGGLQYTNATSNLENFGTAGVNVPSFTTRSTGTKTIWYNALSGTQADFATGIATGVLWNSIPQANLSYRFGFFAGTSEISQLFGDGSQIWAKSGRFTGWGGPANSGPAAEIGVPGGYAIFAGIDRTGTATYYPTILRGGSGTSDPTGKDFRIDASGYGFMAIPNYGAIGTNASGYLINTAGNFIQNQTTAAQSGVGFWTAGNGIANSLRTTAPIGQGDILLFNGGGITNANLRWTLYKSTTETGTGNVGSNFNIGRYTDAGALIDNPLSINRSTGEVTLGTVNNEATDVDKFLVSNGGILRYRTGAQTLADIGAAPLSGAGNYIQNGTAAQTANFNITGNGTFGSLASFAGGIQLTNGTSNLINYSNFGVVAPTFTTRSAGTKLVYYSTLSTAAVDYATGVETSHIWNSVPINSNTVGFKWYGGTTPVARLDGLGSLELVGQGRFRGWYTANGTGPAAELGFSGGVAALYGFDRTAGAYTTLRLGGGNSATGRYFDIDGTGYKFTNLANTKILGTDGLGYLVDNSGAFIQNGTSVQASSNFNISGAGVIGTTLNVGGQTTLNTVSVSGTTNMTGALTASGGVSTTAIKMKEGTANATMGVASFGSGVASVTINTTAVTANSRIFLTPVVTSSSPITGMTAPCLGPRVAGTSFTIFWTKEAVSSTGSVEWMIVEPY